MSDISTLQPTHTLPNGLLTTDAIKHLVDKAGLTPVEAKLVPTVCGAILHAIRHGNTTLRFALGVEAEDNYKPINLEQLDLVINTTSLRDEIVCSDGAIEACQKLVKHLRMVWLDFDTIHYHIDRMGINSDVADVVYGVVSIIGAALLDDDDEILDPLRAQLNKPPLRDAVGGQFAINQVMLDHILGDLNGEVLLRKFFGKPVPTETGHRLHIVRAFLIRLQREMS